MNLKFGGGVSFSARWEWGFHFWYRRAERKELAHHYQNYEGLKEEAEKGKEIDREDYSRDMDLVQRT